MNSRRHGGDVILNTMIHKIQISAHYLIELLNPRMRVIDYSWGDLIKVLSDYRPRLFHCIVNWELSSVGYQKCNTDGASKEIQVQAHIDST